MTNRKLLVPKILGKNNYDEYKENLLETFLRSKDLISLLFLLIFFSSTAFEIITSITLP